MLGNESKRDKKCYSRFRVSPEERDILGYFPKAKKILSYKTLHSTEFSLMFSNDAAIIICTRLVSAL
jgi:hypothetical protein